MNREAMLEVARAIQNRDYGFNMTSWEHCIAGIACKTHGIATDSVTSVQWAARHLLGLDFDQEHDLFYLTQWSVRYQILYCLSFRRTAAAGYIGRVASSA